MTSSSNPVTSHALVALGWGSFFQDAWGEWAELGCRPARVASQYRSRYYLAFGAGETRPGRVSGRFRHHAKSGAEFPAVGDWVAAEAPGHEGECIIRGVLPRKTKFSRKVVGIKSDEQVLVANVDTVFLLMGLDGDFKPRRLERYLVVAHDSGAQPVVLLSKSDLSPDLAADLKECKKLAPDVPVYAICPPTGEGVKNVWKYLKKGTTAVLLGSSGVGKSTLANHLLDEEVQAVQEVRETDSQGRHTTTSRQMFRLEGGALLIDTPGLREIQLWCQGTGVDDTFSDIVKLGEKCRFSDCRHGSEPGCAVKDAVDQGKLSEERWANYAKLKKELVHLERRSVQKAARGNHQAAKTVRRSIHQLPRHEQGDLED
jgi:ribosome biogenesis GTPase